MPRKKVNRARKRKEVMQKRDYEALAAFRYALRKFFRFSEQAAGNVGLSMRQYQALLTICGFPGKDQISMGEMAEWLQIKHHSAVGLVDRLESQNLVTRKRSKGDKRRVLVHITVKGRRVLQRLARLNKEELRRLKPQIQQLSELL